VRGIKHVSEKEQQTQATLRLLLLLQCQHDRKPWWKT